MKKKRILHSPNLITTVLLRRIGHDEQSVTPKGEGDGASPKSLHMLNQNLDHSSTATSAMGLPPTPPDDLDPAGRDNEESDCDSGGGGLLRNGLPLLSSPSSAGSIRYGSNFGFSSVFST